MNVGDARSCPQQHEKRVLAPAAWTRLCCMKYWKDVRCVLWTANGGLLNMSYAAQYVCTDCSEGPYYYRGAAYSYSKFCAAY
jgi:hypothetical protein